MLTMYTKNDCRYCEAAKVFLDINKIPYVAWNVEFSQEARSFLREKKLGTVPQFFADDVLVVNGGYEGLVKLDQEQLDHLKGV